MKTCTFVLAILLIGLGTFSFAQSNPPKLRFVSYDINPKKPWDVTVGINTLDTGKTHFLTIGTKVPGTSWVIKGFTKKESSAADGTKVDRSEITVEDVITREAVNIPLPGSTDTKPAN